MQFTVNEGVFDLPSDMDDRSINMLVTPGSEDNPPYSIIITRDELIGGEDLAGCFERQLKMLKRQTTAYKEITRGEVQHSALREVGFWIESRFKQSGRPVEQIQAMLALDDKKILIITLSTALKLDASMRQIMADTVQKFRPVAN